MRKARIIYAAAAIVLLAAEFAIGLFVHDRFIRPYFGDVLIVILLYVMVRIIFPRKMPFLSLGILLFAILTEVTQCIPLVDVLGIHNRFLRVVMGTSFAWGDLVAYFAGSLINFAQDQWILRKKNNQ